MVELLAGPLVGAAVADKLEERNWGNLLLVVDPELLGDKDVIRTRTQVGGLRSCCSFKVHYCFVRTGQWAGGPYPTVRGYVWSCTRPRSTCLVCTHTQVSGRHPHSHAGLHMVQGPAALVGWAPAHTWIM